MRVNIFPFEHADEKQSQPLDRPEFRQAEYSSSQE
jgi:hypothetical protein